MPGILASAGAAFLTAVNSLLTAFVLGEDKSSGLLGSVELAFFYSMVPTLVLPLVAVAFGEPTRPVTGWDATFSRVAQVAGATAAVACCYASTGLAKFGSRMFRFQLIALRGPFFFCLVNVAARLVTALLAILVLNEGFNWNKGVALVVVVAALGIYAHGAKLAEEEEKARKEAEHSASLSAGAAGPLLPGGIFTSSTEVSSAGEEGQGEGGAEVGLLSSSDRAESNGDPDPVP